MAEYQKKVERNRENEKAREEEEAAAQAAAEEKAAADARAEAERAKAEAAASAAAAANQPKGAKGAGAGAGAAGKKPVAGGSAKPTHAKTASNSAPPPIAGGVRRKPSAGAGVGASAGAAAGISERDVSDLRETIDVCTCMHAVSYHHPPILLSHSLLTLWMR